MLFFMTALLRRYLLDCGIRYMLFGDLYDLSSSGSGWLQQAFHPSFRQVAAVLGMHTCYFKFPVRPCSRLNPAFLLSA